MRMHLLMPLRRPQTLWYLQSSLSDLTNAPASEQFAVCRRVFNRVQSIIFTDPPLPPAPSSPSASEAPPLVPKREKINAPLASFVGLGMLAAAIAQPRVSQACGSVAVEQGRRVEPLSRSVVDDQDGDNEGEAAEGEGEGGSGSDEDRPTASALSSAAPPVKDATKAATTKLALFGKSMFENASAAVSGRPAAPSRSKSMAGSSPSKPRRASAFPNYLPGDRIEPSPSIPISSKFSTAPSHSYLPSRFVSSPAGTSTKGGWSNSAAPPTASPLLGRRRGSAMPNGTSQLSSASVPSLPSSGRVQPSPSASTSHLAGSTLPGYGLPRSFLSRILLLQACRSQLDLLRSLQDISTRLVLVPKPARLSSLRAELTVLNHGLPRGCSLGMSSRDPTRSKTGKNALARIVRISPSESVVLNSADRAPFVIHVEVLERDLDFDPDRRQNAEDLRRALREREGGANDGVMAASAKRASLEAADLKRGGSLGSSVPSTVTTPSVEMDGGDISLPSSSKAAPRPPAPPAEPKEEMDLVEQLYGDVSLRDEPPPPPEPEEEEIHNKAVDEQAWARGSTPTPEEAAERELASAKKPSLATEPRGPSAVAATSKPGGRSVSARPAISLDDYAERMRMAAVMLAQLDASQQASKGVVATGTAAAGTLVGLPVATVAGIGGAVGAGLGAVASRLPFPRAGAAAIAAGAAGRETPPQAGQGSTGTTVSLDTTSAAEGTSAVSGAPAPSSAPSPAHHRPRLLSPAEATMIRERIMSEMMALEEERMARMREDGRARSKWASSGGTEDGSVVMRAVNKDDPSGGCCASVL